MLSNIATLLWQAADQWPDAGFMEGRRHYSFRQARSACAALANTMRDYGVKPGDRVVILAANRPEVILSLFASAAIGAVGVILHEQTTSRSLKHIVGELEPSLVLLGAECADRTEDLAPSPIIDIESVPAAPGAADEIELADGRDRLAFIVYTSGSTGLPRGVMLTHENVLFVVPAIQARLGYKASDRIGVFLPLSFDYGLYQAFLAAQTGACLVIRSNQNAGPLLATTLANDRITVLPGLPNLFTSLIRLASRKAISLPSVRLISSTGAHLPIPQIETLRALLPEASICPMYGLTECKRVSILTPDEYELHPNSVGRPLDGTRAWVANDDGEPLPPGNIGELVVQGPHVSAGYWRSSAETTKRFRSISGSQETALFTGDLFRCDENGYLYYVGRKDEQIKRHGFRISPLDIERVALEQPGVSGASVVVHGERLILFATISLPTLTPNALLERLGLDLEPYKIPDQVIFLDEMPQTRNGKIDTKKLKDHGHATA